MTYQMIKHAQKCSIIGRHIENEQMNSKQYSDTHAAKWQVLDWSKFSCLKLACVTEPYNFENLRKQEYTVNMSMIFKLRVGQGSLLKYTLLLVYSVTTTYHRKGNQKMIGGLSNMLQLQLYL